MTILASLLANWRFGLYGLAAAGLLIGGFWIKGRLVRASEADALERTLEHERKALAKADVDRVELGMKLSEAETDLMLKTNTITKEVVRYVSKDRSCDLSPRVVGLLNAARAGVPPAPDNPAPPAGAP